MRIGELERATGLSRDTIRYYERIGLITRPPRRANGYRDYPPLSATELRFISRAKALGFALDEIRLAIPMLPQGPRRCEVLIGHIEARRAALLEQIEEARDKIQRLDELLERLEASEAPEEDG